MKRFLCICEGGVVRSAALATVLRWDFGQDSLAASFAKTPASTLEMLSAWADYIIVMQPRFSDCVPGKYIDKIRVFDVGPDRWRNPMHDELLDIVGNKVQEWYRANWKL